MKPYVVIEGGLATDSSEEIVVIDLDVLGSDFVDYNTIEEVVYTLRRASEAELPAYISGRLIEWLVAHGFDVDGVNWEGDPADSAGLASWLSVCAGDQKSTTNQEEL